MTRRQHGTGTIFQRADGKWVGRVEAGYTRTGSRRRVSVVGRTEADTKRKLKELQRRIAAEGIPEIGLGHATVKAWADVWLSQHQRTARPKTYATDAGTVHKWIIPTIGHRRLDQLTPADVRGVGNAIRKAGLTSTTARHSHRVLTSMLKAARHEGHAVPARVTEMKAPAKAVNDRTALDPEQLAAILLVARRRPDAARWVAAILQGMRQAEALGLTWQCVNLDAGTVDVSWQLQALPYRTRYDRTSGFRTPDGYESRHLVGAWHLTRPKTTSGYRVIPLVPWMRTELDRWQQVAPANPWGLVWSDGGQPVDPVRDRVEWRAIQQQANVTHPTGRPYVGHETRHAAATLLLEGGVDPATVIAIMGHSSILTTRGYFHVSTALARRALEGVAERLGLT